MRKIPRKYILFSFLAAVLLVSICFGFGFRLKAEDPVNSNQIKALSLKLDTVLIQIKKLSSLKTIENKLDRVIKNQDDLKKEIEALKKRISSRI